MLSNISGKVVAEMILRTTRSRLLSLMTLRSLKRYLRQLISHAAHIVKLILLLSPAASAADRQMIGKIRRQVAFGPRQE